MARKKPTTLSPELEARQKELDEQIMREYPLYFHEMNRAQRKFIRVKNPSGVTPKRRLFEAGNKVGKTEEGIAEDIAHAMGYRPWLREDDPDYRIDVKVPNNGLIGCETMMHSVPEKIEPTLKRLIPKICKPVFKPGPTGVCIRVTLTFDADGKKCGSIIHIRSYDQRPDTFEGIDFDWVHWDEPPPKAVLQAAERGKIVTNAPSWFTMTPLKEPYIYDNFSLKAFTHGGDDPEIAVIRGAIWDNCRDYCRECGIYVEENAVERTLKRCPKCRQVMGFIPKAGIDEYLKTLPAEEREAREEGKWHHLSGLVYKEIDREKHVYDDFPIPKAWTKIESVDPHDARPVHWLFGAVSPEEIEIYGKKRNRIYWYDHLLAKGDLDDIVRQVKSKRALHGYETPYFVVLDKKFGEKTQMEEKSWQGELERRGITRIRLSHSSPGDVELGHKLVREYLKPQFSTLLGTAKPGMLWARQACTGQNSPFHAMCNYQYKENKDKPEEEFKDWCDCYDATTEILTNSGWKRFASLDGSEEVATIDLKTNRLVYQKPYDYIEHEYSGPMVHVNSRSSNLLVTPNHNMIIGNSGGPVWPKINWHFGKAKDLSPTMLLPTSSEGIEVEGHGHTDAFYTFMGWYLAEGSATGTMGGKIQTPGRGYSVYISQSSTANPKYVEEIHTILDKLLYRHWYNGRAFVISNKKLWEYLYPLGNSHDKYIPEDIFKDASPRQLLLLWDTFVKGDGWEQTRKNATVRVACTISKQLASDLQRLLILAGKNASIRERKPNGSFLRGKEIKQENCSLQYYITEKNTNGAYLMDGDKTPKFETVDYSGQVYCLTVPNHTMVVRRNNKVTMCGNCTRYAAMEQPIYKAPEDERKMTNLIMQRNTKAMNARRFHAVTN